MLFLLPHPHRIMGMLDRRAWNTSRHRMESSFSYSVGVNKKTTKRQMLGCWVNTDTHNEIQFTQRNETHIKMNDWMIWVEDDLVRISFLASDVISRMCSVYTKSHTPSPALANSCNDYFSLSSLPPSPVKINSRVSVCTLCFQVLDSIKTNLLNKFTWLWEWNFGALNDSRVAIIIVQCNGTKKIVHSYVILDRVFS